MDPITLATIVATLIATKAIEKVGEKIGERGIQEGGKLVDALRRKAPDTVKRLEAVDDPNVIDAEIIEEVRKVVAAEPEVQAAVIATANAMQQQFGGVIDPKFLSPAQQEKQMLEIEYQNLTEKYELLNNQIEDELNSDNRVTLGVRTIVRAVLSSDDPMVPEVLEVRMGFNPSSGNP